jgi:hypothetical protein
MSTPTRPQNYYCHDEWEHDIFFTIFSLAKEGNLQRQFSSLPKKYELDFPPRSEIRKIKVKGLRVQSGAQ